MCFAGCIVQHMVLLLLLAALQLEPTKLSGAFWFPICIRLLTIVFEQEMKFENVCVARVGMELLSAGILEMEVYPGY